jgi:uncharacterized protein involved in copper resistance
MIIKRTKIFTLAAVMFSMMTVCGSQVWAADSMSGMDNNSMENAAGGAAKKPMSMQGGTAPIDARDPHAYSDGYDFGPIPPPQMADEGYMGGLLVDRLEGAHSRDNSFNAYDLQGWLGKDYNKLVLKAEGEGEGGKLQEARIVGACAGHLLGYAAGATL